MKRRSGVVACWLTAMVLAAVAVAPVGLRGDGWTEDYDCDEAFCTNNHKLDDGVSDWGSSTHPYWPGDCSIHNGPADTE